MKFAFNGVKVGIFVIRILAKIWNNSSHLFVIAFFWQLLKNQTPTHKSPSIQDNQRWVGCNLYLLWYISHMIKEKTIAGLIVLLIFLFYRTYKNNLFILKLKFFRPLIIILISGNFGPNLNFWLTKIVFFAPIVNLSI
jgi:hypothetical protein